MSKDKNRLIEGQRLWKDISDKDFENENNIIDENMATYNLEKMKIFSANINYFRQILRLSDSLKPVERRLLYSLYTINGIPGRKTIKSNRIIGATSSYHAHGDGPIYKAMVGLAQQWKNQVPLIDGSGNFGNDANPDSYAAQRYCVVGSTLLSTNNGLIPFKNIIEDSKLESETNIDIKIQSKDCKINSADKLFNSGIHNVKRITTKYGYNITGTDNHPLLTLTVMNGIPTLQWKLISELLIGDLLVLDGSENILGSSIDYVTEDEAKFLGLMISEGFISTSQNYYRIGINNTDFELANFVENYFISKGFNVSSNILKGANFPLKEIYIHNKEEYNDFIERYNFTPYSNTKEVPDVILKSTKRMQCIFLKYLFEGDGGVKLPNKKSNGGVFYSSSSKRLIEQIQVMLLQFGIISGICPDRTNFKLQIDNKESVTNFYKYIGFASIRKSKNLEYVVTLKNKHKENSTGYNHPYILSNFIRNNAIQNKHYLKTHQLSTKNSFLDKLNILQNSLDRKDLDYIFPFYTNYLYLPITLIEDKSPEVVYSIRVNSDCHSFVGNGFINHNTEALISRYAYECFFEDYDDDCVEKILNTSIDGPEPLSLPAKFPNILINGGMGIAVGNAFVIPPYNIDDIISLCKRLIVNPDDPNIYLIPDLPTGCDIIDDGVSLKEICETGKGVLRMRAHITIEERPRTWVLSISRIPWLVSMDTVYEKLVDLTKKGILPIKDIQNRSDKITQKNGNVRTLIDYKVIIDKSYDPYVIRDKIFKLTELGKSAGVNFKVVMEGFSIDRLNLKDLVLAWLDERREYKRRLLNKKITKLMARISLLDVLIRLTEQGNIDKTIKIIRTNDLNDVVPALMRHDSMTSFQATKIADMKIAAFTKDAHDKYVLERDKVNIELEKIMNLIKSEKKIDKIILEELDDLKKYALPRKSQVISNNTEKKVSNTDHIIIVTKQGLIKKLLDVPNRTTYGSFKNLDYPMHKVNINNMDTIIFFDSFGRFTTLPVYDIENTEMSAYGNTVYDATRLNGEIISAFQSIKSGTNDFIKDQMGDKLYLVTLTKGGYLKKTPMSEFTNIKSTKNVKAMKLKDGDNLIYSDILLESSDVMVYTKKGSFVFISGKDIAEQSKDSMGLMSIKLNDEDECVGLTVISKSDKYILVITEKGIMKKSEIEFLGSAGKRKVDASYLITLDENDAVYAVDTVGDNKTVTICTRTEIMEFNSDDIPTLARRAKGKKMIPLPVGSNIITYSIN